MSNLYRQDTTRALAIHLSDPGAGWTKIDDMPPGPIAAIVDWWRALDLDGAESQWHPTAQSTVDEVARPPGLAGSGVNILPRKYSSFDADTLPPLTLSNMTAELVADGYNASQCVSIKSTGADGYVWFAASDTDWPIKITANKRWIISVFTRAPLASQPYTARLSLTSDGSNSELIDITGAVTTATANAWKRQSLAFDFSSKDATKMRFGLKFTGAAGQAMAVDAVMMEEWLGDARDPSAFVDGVA